MSNSHHTDELEAKVKQVFDSLANVESFQRNVTEEELFRAAIAIRDLARRVFSSEPAIDAEDDPELNREYLVVHVKTNAELEEAVRLNHQWHSGLREEVGKAAAHFRLSMDVL